LVGLDGVDDEDVGLLRCRNEETKNHFVADLVKNGSNLAESTLFRIWQC
jgi:hypothetical protein